MAGEALLSGDLLHASLRAFRAKRARSETIIADALATMARPYVAWSLGKDSTAVLALVRRQCPDIAVLWADDELEYPENPGYATALAARWGLDFTPIAGFARHAGWFDPWRTPPPFRAPLLGMLPTGMRMEPWSVAAGYDGVFVGLRKDEARHRRIHLSTRGPLYWMAGEGQWRCNPLAGWTTDDVWAFIAHAGIPYNPVYDTLARIGVPRARQRVGPLPLSDGWMLRRGWPDLYARLVARYGAQWGGD